MGHIEVGREKYYIDSQIKQQYPLDDHQLLIDLQKVLDGKDSFLMCGRSFDLLENLGFVETTYDLMDKPVAIMSNNRHFEDINYDRIFTKTEGDIVTEIYFKKESFTFKEDHNDYFYHLRLKGSYHKSSLPKEKLGFNNIETVKLAKTKKLSFVNYHDNNDIKISCTVTKNRNIWFCNVKTFDTISLFKQYESSMFFDVSVINYTHKKLIESVIFRVGHKRIMLNEIEDICPEFLKLKPIEQINWEKHLTPEQLNIIEMKYI